MGHPPGSSMREESKHIPRMDIVDSVFAVWAALFVLFNHHLGPFPVFPAAHILLVLFVVLLSRRVAVPQANRAIQFLIVAFLSLASGLAMAFAPIGNHLLKNWAAIVLFFWAWAATREFISRVLGFSSAVGIQIKDLRAVFLWPGVAAVLVALAGIVLLESRTIPQARLVFISLWLVPFAMTLVLLRRIPLQVALSYLERPKLWQEVFGGPKTILGVVAVISLLGFALESLGGQHYLAWSAITGILLLQALLILQIQQWARRAESRVL